jgi:excinuclease ABC subunit C
LQSGSATIKNRLTNLPPTPGIYMMLSHSSEILYIGKAKNLQKRVTYYAKPDLPERLRVMVSKVHDIEHIVTKSETEALLLEARLVKKHQPKFNILLKDDKSFPYIRFRSDHDFPQILKLRSKSTPEGKFFGPFASNDDVDTTLAELQKIFKLRPCSDNYFASRRRPCLQYQIKRCYAPCVGKISKAEYAELANQVLSFLGGKTKELQDDLAKQMEDLSASMDYEKAAELRDRIKALSYVQLKFGQAQGVLGDADLIRLDVMHGTYSILVAFYRSSQYYGNKVYFPTHTQGATEDEVLEAFIEQFYSDKPKPDEIIVSLGRAISEEPSGSRGGIHETFVSSTKETKITIPTKGPKFQLLQSFENTAKEALEKHIQSSLKHKQILKSLQVLFHLPQEPERIEVYDNSHIMGQHAVGAMVVAGRDGFQPKEYRCINVISSSLTGGDDYDMLRQVLTRRLDRIKKDPESTPSLMIIDGGKGHMSRVASIMDKFAINIPFVCMSKGEDRNSGREWFHGPGFESFTISPNDKVMQYLQVLRDEVHNYAIRKHRLKRSKAITTSVLDDVPGVGLQRKKDLLQNFGSIERIKNASFAELASVSSIGKSTARKVFDALHHKDK